jgi:hypothetical protein
MNNAAKSILVFGIYLLLTGLTLVFLPNTLLGLFGFPAANEIWIKVFGILATILGLYFVQAARENNIGFFRMTLVARVLFMISISALGLLTPGYTMLILFGLVDLAGAAWTWWALRQEAKTGLQVN